MKQDKDYVEAVNQAQDNLNDVIERGEDAIGENALDFMDKFLTDEEVRESNFRAELISEIIKARQEKGISQKKLEELSGVKQPIIARMEKCVTSPQVETILKILAPLGKTLAVVPLDNK